MARPFGGPSIGKHCGGLYPGSDQKLPVGLMAMSSRMVPSGTTVLYVLLRSSKDSKASTSVLGVWWWQGANGRPGTVGVVGEECGDVGLIRASWQNSSQSDRDDDARQTDQVRGREREGARGRPDHALLHACTPARLHAPFEFVKQPYWWSTLIQI